MRKIYLSLLAALTLAPASAETFMATDFATADDFAAWTVVDKNRDGITWKFDSEAEPYHVYYQYSDKRPGNDWLISPAITPAVTGKLMLKYTCMGSSLGENMEIYAGPEASDQGMELLKTCTDLPYKAQSDYVMVPVTEGVPVHVAFKCTTPKDHYRLYLCSVELTDDADPVDLTVASILSPVSGENLGQEPVRVSVGNVGSAPAQGFDLSFQTDRMDQPVTEHVDATLEPGASMDYEFAARVDLSEPRHDYALRVWATYAGDINNSNNQAAATVRHQALATAPYSMGFELGDYLDGLRCFDSNGDSKTWKLTPDETYYKFSNSGVASMCYYYSKEHDADDWVILEPVAVEPGSYAVRYFYSGTENHIEAMDVWYGSEQKPEAMNVRVASHETIDNPGYEEAIHIVTVTEPGQLCLGFHAVSPKDENVLCLDDVSIYRIESEAADVSVGAITSPLDCLRPGRDPKVEFSVTNRGVESTTARVSVAVDGKPVTEMPVSLLAQESRTVTAATALAGLDPGDHEITVTATCDGDSDAGNNTAAHTFRMLPDPAKTWDMEDGRLPADFTFRAEDAGTVNPDCGPEFTEPHGWSIFEVEQHPIFGRYMLAGASWLTGTDRADRWAVLPKLAVDADDAYLAFDVFSLNANYREDYDIMVAVDRDERGSYAPVMEVRQEPTSTKTRGLSLAPYVGREIYVAVNLVSPICEVLVLDNVSVHGQVRALSSGVEDVAQGQVTLVYNGRSVMALGGVPAGGITVYDMRGVAVARTAGALVDISHLPAGAYIATASAATLKVVKE